MGLACCEQGGCFSQAPKRVIKNPDGTTLRVNVLYTPVGCFDIHPGLSDEDIKQVPEQLAMKGLERSMWNHWVTRELMKVQELREPPGPAILCCIFCFPCVLMSLPCIGGSLAKKNNDMLRKWDDAMRKWLCDLNSQVLEPYGIWAKTQSHCHLVHKRDGKKEKRTERWIAFAFTPEEIDKLKQEPHLTGHIEKGGCGGPVESDFCMHP